METWCVVYRTADGKVAAPPFILHADGAKATTEQFARDYNRRESVKADAVRVHAVAVKWEDRDRVFTPPVTA